MNTIQTKIPLSECRQLALNGSVSNFRIDKRNAEKLALSGKIRITTSAIGGFETNYQEDTMKPKEFILLAHATNSTGVEIKINEEMLQQMLDYIKTEKQKTYCIEGST